MDLIHHIIVILSQFLQGRNVLSSKEHFVNNPLVIMIIKDILSIKIWGATMVDESLHITILGSITGEAAILHIFTRNWLCIRHVAWPSKVHPKEYDCCSYSQYQKDTHHYQFFVQVLLFKKVHTHTLEALLLQWPHCDCMGSLPHFWLHKNISPCQSIH